MNDTSHFCKCKCVIQMQGKRLAPTKNLASYQGKKSHQRNQDQLMGLIKGVPIIKSA